MQLENNVKGFRPDCPSVLICNDSPCAWPQILASPPKKSPGCSFWSRFVTQRYKPIIFHGLLWLFASSLPVAIETSVCRAADLKLGALIQHQSQVCKFTTYTPSVFTCLVYHLFTVFEIKKMWLRGGQNVHLILGTSLPPNLFKMLNFMWAKWKHRTCQFMTIFYQ